MLDRLRDADVSGFCPTGPHASACWCVADPPVSTCTVSPKDEAGDHADLRPEDDARWCRPRGGYCPTRRWPGACPPGGQSSAGILQQRGLSRYEKGMKSNAKSSVTLPAEELELVMKLKRRLRVKSNVEVVRRGLRLLQETTDRAALRESYRQASDAVRGRNASDRKELDGLIDEGID